MKKLSLLILFVFSLGFSYAQYTETAASGLWNSPGNWTNGAPVGGTTTVVNHPMDLNINLDVGANTVINSPVTDDGGTHNLNVWSSGSLEINEMLTVYGAATISGRLIVRDTMYVDNITFNCGSSLVIEEGGLLASNTNFVNSTGSVNLVVNGYVYVNGNITANDGSMISGSGEIEVFGNTLFNGTGTIFGNNSTCSNCTLAGGAQDTIIYLCEDFECGAIDGWHEKAASDWAASTTTPIDGSYSLKHNLSGVAGDSWASHSLNGLDVTAGTTTWRFEMTNGAWDPSGTNNFRVHLFQNDTSMQSPTKDGYILAVNWSGSTDTLTLHKITGGGNGTPSELIVSTVDWNASTIVGVEVTRTATGDWELKVDHDGGFDNLVSEGTATDNEHTDASFFGVNFEYTSTRAGELWVDNICVTQVPETSNGCLIAHYPFNGNANDESGNGNDGVVNGAVLAEDRYGNANSAYYFDGNDYIIADIDTNYSEYSVEFWMKTPYPSRWYPRMFSLGMTTTNTGFGLHQNGNHSSYVGAGTVGALYCDRGLLTDVNLEFDEWHHVVVSTNRDSVSITVDGSNIIYASGISHIYFSTTDLIFGVTSNFLFDNYLIGALDDIRIYSCMLDSAQIDSIWKAECIPFTTTDSAHICNGDSIYLEGAWQNTSGTYIDTLIATNGCDSIVATTLNLFPALNLSYNNHTDESCFNSNDGTITFDVTGGEIPYSIEWYNLTFGGANLPVFQGFSYADNLGFNSEYQMVVEDANGCIDSISQLISGPPQITATDNVTIYAGDSILIGSTYYSQPGTYYPTLTATNGCDSLLELTINVDSICTFTVNTPQQQNASCFGECNGGAIVVPSGTPPFAFNWSNGHNQSFQNQLCAGIYGVTVYDGAGCEGVVSITISEPDEIILNTTTTNSSCGINDGSAVVSVTGGVQPYTYQWTSGDTLETADSLSAGAYLLRVIDDLGCEVQQPILISDANSPTVSTVKTNVSCFGNNDGSINVSVSGGATPYSYYWSNGYTTQDLSNLTVGPYELDVIDANNCINSSSVIITQPQPLNVNGNVSEASCGSSDGSISTNLSGGTAPYTLLWSNGSTSTSITGLAAGLYEVTISDNNSCSNSFVIPLSESNAPLVQIDSILNVSCGSSSGSVYITPISGSSSYTYLWSTGGLTEDMENKPAGNYSVTVSGANGCKTVLVTDISEAVLDTPKICIVTVDTTIGKNVVVWEKQQGQGISEYKIYKESTQANVYFLAGTIPYDSASVFVDSLANPLVRSWRYRLTSVDSCGNESAFSPIHKTIHLAINLGLGNTINLAWDDYEGFDYSTFYINRFKVSTGWEVIDSVPSNLTSYTDFTPPLGGLWYVIEARHPDGGCNPNLFKAANYSQSRSNRPTKTSIGPDTTTTDTTGTGSGINLNYSENGFMVYPNPTSEFLTISSSQNQLVTIHNSLGVEVKRIRIQTGINRFDISNLSPGVYLVTGAENNYTTRVVIY